PFGRAGRRVELRPLHQAGQESRLLDAHRLRGLREIELRGGLDAVAAIAHVDLVAIEAEDFVLGERFLDLQGEDHLLELPAERLLGLEEERPGELLGDGAGALRLSKVDDVRYNRPGDSPEIDPHVPEEAGILRGDQGVDERVGNLIEPDDDPLLGAELVENLTIGAVERRDDARLPVLKLLDLGNIEGEDVAYDRAAGDRNEQRREDQRRQPAPAPPEKRTRRARR